jgi:hypothetical protein
MSKPRRNPGKNAASSAMGEINAAISALNMHPEPIEPTQHFHNPNDCGLDEYEPCYWLSSTDKWAAHAVEHLNAAIEYTSDAWSEIERLQERIITLECQLKGELR